MRHETRHYDIHHSNARYNNIKTRQCDQIWRNFATWATLAYFTVNKFSPDLVVSACGFQKRVNVDVLGFQI